jgi:hypothetical protein
MSEGIFEIRRPSAAILDDLAEQLAGLTAGRVGRVQQNNGSNTATTLQWFFVLEGDFPNGMSELYVGADSLALCVDLQRGLRVVVDRPVGRA